MLEHYGSAPSATSSPVGQRNPRYNNNTALYQKFCNNDTRLGYLSTYLKDRSIPEHKVLWLSH